jgi:hypothetical protein
VLRAGKPVGRIIGTLTPSRAMPKTRYQVEVLMERKIVQVLAEEVEVVRCNSIFGASESGSTEGMG